MKTTIINQIAVLDRAKTMVLKGYNLNDSLITSSMIELLQLKMANGVAHFLYKKKDGSIREVWGTLLQKVVRTTKTFTSYISETDKALIN